MFDIGFWELITIALIVLIMVRPEHLPKLAKDAGKFLARLRNFIYSAKKELAKEFKIEEINELQNSINHVDRLMQNSPDKKIIEENNDDEKIK
ncbi:MAG: Sec-independent protein translocase protein TatB [Pseudomonadota bacterium]|nr:Sec-independent protein translocase protein TatB [Pseudomonadota bacterium]|tara:strand:- start:1112 stop:1390 length:279 start_codon:yes stop_codon:yes gene_type:complete